MKVVKKFKDFSLVKEDLENGELAPSTEVSAGKPTEVEETPLTQVSSALGLEVETDDRGEFIKTEEGKIRYFSETGYYNETKRKSYGEDVQAVINSLQIPAEEGETSVVEGRRHKKSCKKGCNCHKK